MPQLFDQLRSFLNEVDGEKRASVKKAAGTEAGSIGGATTHPVGSVDDQTSKATEGSRSAENTADVKKTIPISVDATSGTGPDQEGQQFNVGLKSTETGKDPSNEDAFKGDKDDPGTSHPAKTDDGEKYGSMSFSQLKKLSEKKANDIMAEIAVGAKQAAARPMPAAPQAKREAPKAAVPAKSPETTAAKAEQLKAAAAGYELASNAVQAASANDAQVKTAAAVEQTIRDALAAATMTGNYLREYEKQARMRKRAEDDAEAAPPAKDDSDGDEGAAPGDAPADAGGGGAPPGLGLDPSMLGDMSGGGGGGGPPPAAGGGGAGGSPEAVQQLLMALIEMGVSPDEIMQQLQAAGGAGGGAPPGGMPPDMGGGMPPDMGGGMPPDMGGGMPPDTGAPKMARARANKMRTDLIQLVKTAKAYQRSGRFQFKAASTPAEMRLRNEIKKCISEIVS